ncbi:Pycsar system effector family protein [Xanthomonas arboricola]|uniref:Pycsar system effector family protein n=1 Tax=Xanthomonas arboricola TaxID=56448 RepID=UPI0011AFDB61|nr:Pycsar system effector family protein [Xanthomonas arboricola]
MTMDAEKRAELSKSVLDRHITWINAADSKAAFSVAASTTLLAGLAAAYEKAHIVEWLAASLTVLSAILACGAVLCGSMVVRARTTGPESSIIFFGKIANLSAGEYLSKLIAINSEELLRDYAHQIHRNSQIAVSKYKWVTRSLTLAKLSGIAWVPAIALLITKG